MIDLFSVTISRQKPLMMTLIFPLGMSAALWFGIIGEYSHISGIPHPGISYRFFQSIASVTPFIAAVTAIIFVLYRPQNSTQIKVLLLGPLGFAIAYGFVGIVSAFKSPDGSVAIYWAASYLSVPIVLLAVTSRGVATEQLSIIIRFIRAVFGIAVVLLLAFGLIKLNLWNVLIDPGDWIRCPPQAWYVESSHLIRETAVGRYAAVAGLFSLSALWQRNWRIFWAIIFLISVFLLVTSGARTSVAGFMLGAPLVILLHGGKKSALAGLISIAFLIPIFWSTGIHQTFLDTCVWRVPSSTSPTAAISEMTTAAVSSTSPTAAISEMTTAAVSEMPSAVKTEAAANVTTTPQSTSIEVHSDPDRPAFHNRFLGQVPDGFIEFNGRRSIWADSLEHFKDSPIFGHGFHADRLLLTQHAHNSYIHVLIQTGILGGLAFIGVISFTFNHSIRIIKNLRRFPDEHKHLLISSSGILLYLVVRSLAESTGAFFGVDWLLLAPLLLYVQVMNQLKSQGDEPL